MSAFNSTSAAQWQTGSVAMVECSDGVWRQAVCHLDRDLGTVWEFWDGGLRKVSESSARALAVIDPEDREEVERLWRADANRYGVHGRPQPEEVTHLQEALREFTKPSSPRLSEPSMLGAVVMDGSGCRWVRARNHRQPWVGTNGRWYEWSDFKAIEVLSEGVTA